MTLQTITHLALGFIFIGRQLLEELTALLNFFHLYTVGLTVD